MSVKKRKRNALIDGLISGEGKIRNNIFVSKQFKGLTSGGLISTGATLTWDFTIRILTKKLHLLFHLDTTSQMHKHKLEL